MLTIDVLMVIFAVPQSLLYFFTFGAPTAVAVLAGLACYKLVVAWRLGAAPVAAEPRTLLLRVFGFDRRTQLLLEQLGLRWRHLGPIRLIAGIDVADSTLEPHEFFEYLNRRLTRAFIKSPAEIDRHLAQRSAARDPDGRYRIEDFFCHDDTWQPTFARLARDAHGVLMDLRGFAPANRGCIFEIEQLIASIPLPRIVLLVDGTTDLAFLEQTLRAAWRTMPAAARNAAPGRYSIRLLRASPRSARTAETLVGLLAAPA
jgi:hypothetical protein